MNTVDSVEALEALYETAVQGALDKVQRRITPLYRQWIEGARFCVLSTVGPEGTDASPRGDSGPVASVVDPSTLHLPDWRGNNRLDSLRNIVRDGRVSLMFMAHGCNNVVRINGTAVLTADPVLCTAFARDTRQPRSVIVVSVGEVYFQCAKALMRSALWDPARAPDALPSAGAFLREVDADFDADAYDAGYPEYARPRMW